MIRHKIAYTLFGLSSLCKALAKLVVTKERTIVCDALSLPGWFILDECIIHHITVRHKGFPGFEWRYWSMPDEYCRQLRILKHKEKANA